MDIVDYIAIGFLAACMLCGGAMALQLAAIAARHDLSGGAQRGKSKVALVRNLKI